MGHTNEPLPKQGARYRAFLPDKKEMPSSVVRTRDLIGSKPTENLETTGSLEKTLQTKNPQHQEPYNPSMDTRINLYSLGSQQSFEPSVETPECSDTELSTSGEDSSIAKLKFSNEDSGAAAHVVTGQYWMQYRLISSEILHWFWRLVNPYTSLSFLLSIWLEGSNHPTKMCDVVIYYKFGILIHETGHTLVMRALQVDFYPIIFVPFKGAFVSPRTKCQNVYDEALIAAAGPLMGALAAAWMGFAGHYLQSNALLVASAVLFGNQLGNLGGWGALDGARILRVISPFLVVLSTIHYIYMLPTQNTKLGNYEATLFFLGLRELFDRLWGSGKDNGCGQAYYLISITKRLCLMGFFLFLIAAIVLTQQLTLASIDGALVSALTWTAASGLFFQYVIHIARKRTKDLSNVELFTENGQTNNELGGRKEEAAEVELIEEQDGEHAHEAKLEPINADTKFKIE